MSGCIYGAKYQTKKVKGKNGKMVDELVLDAQKQKILLIACGKICAPLSDMCPKHVMMTNAKEAKKPSVR